MTTDRSRDWWERVPRKTWKKTYQREHLEMQSRTPISVAKYLSNEAANYSKSYAPTQPKPRESDT